MPADYQILLIHPTTGDQLDLIDASRILKLQFSKKLHDFGTMQLTLLASDNATQYQDLTDMLMEIYRDSGDGFGKIETYFLRYTEPVLDNKENELIILGGQAIISLFQYRVIRVEDDPLGANGFSTKEGFADAVMRSFVVDQAINPAVDTDRIIPGLSAAAVANVGQPVLRRVDGGTLLEVLQDLTVQGATDFELYRTTGANFEFFAGLVGELKTKTANYPFNPFVYFAPERGNMRNPIMSIDRREEITATYVQGQGIESDRIELLFKSAAIFDSPFNRRENISDAREIENDSSVVLGLQTSGAAELRDKQAQYKFSFQIDTDAPQGAYVTDWDIGDRVTAAYKDIEHDFRITAVEVTVQADTEEISPTLEVQ